MPKSTKNIDYLNEDDILNNQKWICMSFLSPEGLMNCKIRGLKIRGTYATREEADTRAKYLQSIDPDFHVFVGEVGKWLPWDPDPNSIEDQVYREGKLNEIMQKYKENQVKSKLMEEERKNAYLSESVRAKEKENKKESRKEKLRNKLDKKHAAAKIEEIPETPKFVQKEPMIPKRIVEEPSDKMELIEAQDEITIKREDIENKKETVHSIDDQLAKIEGLYKKLQNKNKNAVV